MNRARPMAAQLINLFNMSAYNTTMEAAVLFPIYLLISFPGIFLWGFSIECQKGSVCVYKYTRMRPSKGGSGVAMSHLFMYRCR